MHKFIVRPASLGDVPELVLNLRSEDKRELVEGTGGDHPLLSIAAYTLESDAVTCTSADGRIAALAGTYDDGRVWMLCTKVAQEFPIAFVRECKKWLSTRSHPLLHNVADIRNTQHLKLLKLLGFKFLRIAPTGPSNLPFIEFVKVWQHHY